MKLTQRITLVIVLICIAFMVAVRSNSVHEFYKNTLKRDDAQRTYLTEVIKESLSPLIWSVDLEALTYFTELLSGHELVEGILINVHHQITPKEEPLSGFLKGRGRYEGSLSALAPAIDQPHIQLVDVTAVWQEQAIGTIHILFTSEPRERILKDRILEEILDLLIELVLFAGLVFIAFQRLFIKPFTKAHQMATLLRRAVADLSIKKEKEDSLPPEAVTPLTDITHRYREALERKDEVGDFYFAFNALIHTVSKLIVELSLQSSKLKDWNDELESRVNNRTQELTHANEQLQVSMETLKKTQSRLLHQEKLASIGQLAAGVAHEINNPVGFIASNINRLNEYTESLIELTEALAPFCKSDDTLNALREKHDYEFIKEDLPDLLQDCREGANRIREIVMNLKDFARAEEATELAPHNINDAFTSTLKLVHNELKYHCTVHQDLQNTAIVPMNLGSINQVVSNLLVNAAHAIRQNGGAGDIYLSTWQDETWVYAQIKDTGGGIAPRHLEKVFDPFFTTKPVGEGTGLGLNICWDIIVNQHKGDLSVQSTLGEGATFLIKLPVIPQLR